MSNRALSAAFDEEVPPWRIADEQRDADLRDAADEFVASVADSWSRGDGEGGMVLRAVLDAAARLGLDVPGSSSSGAPAKRKGIPRALSRAVMERDEYRCVDCGTHLDLTCDHVIPVIKGGPTTLENLATRCRPCNSRKGTELEARP